jgi:membrane peptidoglycan carboxypeptidase
VFVTEITRADGSVLYRRPSTLRRAIPTAVARGVNGILSQVIQRGTGTAAQLGARPAAGKTGTANEWRDAWFVGYTPELVAAVWVGFPERLRSMVPPATAIRVTGGSWPAQIWRRVMEPALGDSPVTPFPAPDPVARPPEPGPTPDTSLIRSSDDPESRTSLVLPRPVVIVNTVGFSVDRAARLLQTSGLSVDIVVEDPPSGERKRPGRVWKQAPDGGAVIDEGQTVRIWVSR